MNKRSNALPDAGTGEAFLICYLMVAAVAGIAVLAAGAIGVLPAAFVVVAHVALAGGVWVFPAVRRDRAMAAIAMVSMLVMGPVGAMGMLVLVRQMRQPSITNEIPFGWHRGTPWLFHPDPARLICESVREGRAFAADGSTHVERYAEVLADGDLADRQTLLGRISKRFHPDHMPVLKAALTSDTPSVRVSAAAVFARLREINRSSLSVQVETSVRGNNFDVDSALEHARKLAVAARSGLLNASDSERARKSAIGILLAERSVVDRLDAVEALLCGLLLESGQDEEIKNRLGPHAANLSPALKTILLRARMRTHDYSAIALLVEGQAGEKIGSDRHRRPASWRPLIAERRLDTGATGTSRLNRPHPEYASSTTGVLARAGGGKGER